jgi:hypothetical protein
LCPAFRPLPPFDLAGSAGLGFSSSPVSPSGHGRGDDGDSQVPGEPRCGRALLFDPGGTGGPGLVQPDRCCLPITLPRRLPQRRFLSRLNDTAHPLAVYASQPGLLPDHARLASGCWPALPGGIGYPLGSNARFSFSCCTSLPRLLLAHSVLANPRKPNTNRAPAGAMESLHLPVWRTLSRPVGALVGKPPFRRFPVGHLRLCAISPIWG